MAKSALCSSLEYLSGEFRERAVRYAEGLERPIFLGTKDDPFQSGIAAGLRLAMIEVDKVYRFRCGRGR